ncbi:MAG: hypothetical protein IJ306_10185, partial [Oscillospiraceae bacterium]|nr:hypothetical protein [Oscillospiraceae bacterium]
MKKFLTAVLFIILVLCISVTAFAEDTGIIASGYCGADGYGENMHWELTAGGSLRITGSGDMKDYTYTEAPWIEYKNKITSLFLEEGITSIGDKAFFN